MTTDDAGRALRQYVIEQRNEAFITLDLEWARKNAPRAGDDETLLLALHKARYVCRDIPEELRRLSAAWLRDGGHLDPYGNPPVTAEQPLP